MSERMVSYETVIAAMKTIEEETIKRAASVAKEFGDRRNMAAAQSGDKAKGMTSAAYRISNEIQKMERKAR